MRGLGSQGETRTWGIAELWHVLASKGGLIVSQLGYVIKTINPGSWFKP